MAARSCMASGALALAVIGVSATAQSNRAVGSNPLLDAARRRPPVTTSLPGPEYNGAVEAVVDGRRTGLERSDPAVVGGGGVAFEQITGDHSTVRIAAGSRIEFVIRNDYHNIEPDTALHVFRLVTQGKGLRRYQAFGRLPKGMISLAGQNVALRGEGYGPVFYRMTPLAPLAAGEYAAVGGNGSWYAFGVD